MKFNHLNVPTHWQNYWTRYPEGHTILEALIQWVSQVDSMVDNQNNLNDNVEQFRNEIELFVESFDDRLQTEVTQTLNDWQTSGFLAVVISSALQWQLDDYVATNEQDKASMSDNIKFVRNIRGGETYGKIDLSQIDDSFDHAIDFDIWKNQRGAWEHNFHINEDNYSVRYVKIDGSSANDGLTPETAWGSIGNAIDQCEAHSGTHYKLVVIGERMRRQNVRAQKNITKNYIITSEIPLGTNEETSFTQETGSIYTTPMTYEPASVFRLDRKGVLGLPKKYTKATTKANMYATDASYWWEDNTLFVNGYNTTDLNTVCVVNDALWQFTITGSNNHLILEDMTLLCGGIGQNLYVTTNGALKGKFYAHKIKADFVPREGVSTNGFYTDNVRDIKLLDCVGLNASRDIFNYHSTKTGGGMVLELNCIGDNAGEVDLNTNNNISTAHDGIHIVRINTKAHNSRGPVIADVNGCVSILIDCDASGTRLPSLTVNNASFLFTDEPSMTVPSPNGRAYLLDCSGGSDKEYGINAYGDFKEKIYVRNFNGGNIPEDIQLTLI